MEPKQFPVENLDPTASIGVVSLLSDEIHLRYDGATVFQNRNTKDKVPQWKIDEFVSNVAATSLARGSVHRVGVISNHGMLDPLTGSVTTYFPLFERAEKNQLDTLIVIRPFEPSRSNYFQGGYGLWDSSGWKSVQSHCAYSWVAVEVWDVDSKDKIGYEDGRTCDRDESIEVKDQLADYSLAQQTQIEHLIKKSLRQSTTAALHRLGAI
jgi:hypothetical protein